MTTEMTSAALLAELDALVTARLAFRSWATGHRSAVS
jgi:hypothetical protein